MFTINSKIRIHNINENKIKLSCLDHTINPLSSRRRDEVREKSRIKNTFCTFLLHYCVCGVLPQIYVDVCDAPSGEGVHREFKFVER